MYRAVCSIQSVKPKDALAKYWYRYKGPWWCHRIRSERISQLIVDLGYDTLHLQHWAGWNSPDMPSLYSAITPRDLANEESFINYNFRKSIEPRSYTPKPLVEPKKPISEGEFS